MIYVRKPLLLAMCLSLAILTTACDEKVEEINTNAEQQEQAAQAMKVHTVTAKKQHVFLEDILPGRVVAFRTAEIRPQVSGIVLSRSFEQGSEVKAGDTLFQVNPNTFKAEVDTAAASLKKAEASLNAERIKIERLKPLVEADAISKQSYDDSVAVEAQAAAEVAQAKAILQRRKLDLEFATVVSPISGRIDQAFVTEGALVNPTDVNPMAVVQQIDQVYVDVRQPAARLEALRSTIKNAEANTSIEIVSSAGEAYPQKGKLLFSGINVDSGTGDVVVRILVPNAGGELLPGMYVRAKLPGTVNESGILVPQQAIQRDPAGKAFVNIVENDKASIRSVESGDIVNGQYVILSGLNDGDVVVVYGGENLQPDMPVIAVDISQSNASGMKKNDAAAPLDPIEDSVDASSNNQKTKE